MVLEKHDIDKSGCIDFCEWSWFYRSNWFIQRWPSPIDNPGIVEELFLKTNDEFGDGDCCLNLRELTHVINDQLGGIREGPVREDEIALPERAKAAVVVFEGVSLSGASISGKAEFTESE